MTEKICNLCNKEITYETPFNVSGKHYHHICRFYYQWPTKEEYLKMLEEQES